MDSMVHFASTIAYLFAECTLRIKTVKRGHFFKNSLASELRQGGNQSIQRTGLTILNGSTRLASILRCDVSRGMMELSTTSHAWQERKPNKQLLLSFMEPNPPTARPFRRDAVVEETVVPSSRSHTTAAPSRLVSFRGRPEQRQRPGISGCLISRTLSISRLG